MPGVYGRRWCITSWDPIDLTKIYEDERFVFFVGQPEMTASGRFHLQSYVETSVNVNIRFLKTVFGNSAHCTKANGSHSANVAYCTKDATRCAGASPIRYERAPPLRIVDVRCYLGPTGVGKSYSAYQEFPLAFRKNNTKWWDGYDDHTVVIWDDFDGSAIPICDALQLLDIYPLQVEIKGKMINFSATTIILTTNVHPNQWYQSAPYEQKQALLRRMKIKRFAQARIWSNID